MRRTRRSSRYWIALGAIVLLFMVVGSRIAYISINQHAWYRETSAAQDGATTNVLVRGNIYLARLSGGSILAATNQRFPLLIATPAKILSEDIENISNKLSEILSIDKSTIKQSLTAQQDNRIVARKLTEEQVSRISDLKIQGIAIGNETDRSYPLGNLSADALGFLGYTKDGRAGQYGVEEAYEKALVGTPPDPAPTWSAIKSIAALFKKEEKKADEQSRQQEDIELSIDQEIQTKAEDILDRTIRQYKAASGVVIVQEPKTGRILALADRPSFDPNKYGSSPITNFQNSALESFEPGSSFKPITMAIALENNLLNPQTTYNDDHDVVVDGYTIKNFNEGHFGLVTMTKVLEKSINTGMIYVQSVIGNDRFLSGLTDFEFGQKTGVDLPNEAVGNIENLYTGRKINFMTASFGQGISVTPIQLISAYSAIANGGNLMKPTIVQAFIDSRGNRREVSPEIRSTPIRAQTASTLKSMLVSVVDQGFDKARIFGYDIAGKTGTAQISNPKGGYLEGQYNHSFVGFAPASNPRFTIFMKIERPKGITFAADSLSPAFRELAQFLIQYFSIPPTR